MFVQATRRVERSRVFCKLRDRLPVSSWVVRIVSVLPVARVVSTLLYHSTLRLKVQDQRMGGGGGGGFIRTCNGAILSPPVRTDCWGCASRHGVNTVRPQSGAEIFPCYSTAAARSRVAIGEHHTAPRSAGLPCYPTQGGAERPPCMLCTNDYDARGTIVRRWDRCPPWIPVADSALVAYSHPLKSKGRLAVAKAVALRINLNIAGCGVVSPPMHQGTVRLA